MGSLPEEHYLEVTSANEPHLYSFVEEICAQHKIPVPKIYFPKTENMKPLDKFISDLGAGVGLFKDKSCYMVLGQRMRDVYEYSSGGHVGEPFKGMIAHELGHIVNGDGHSWSSKVIEHSPYIGVVVGLAGTFLYEHLQHNAQLDREAGKSEDEVNDRMKALWDAVDQDKSFTREHNYIATAAKYAAGAALGLFGGLVTYSLGRRHMEFAADRFSAKALGSGKPMIEGLKLGRKAWVDAAHESPELLARMGSSNPWQHYLSSLQHPHDMERFKRLEAWTPSR